MQKFTLALLSAAALALGAQSVPPTINYQGRLTDNSPSQTPLNATVQMQFAIFDAASGGTRLWQEPAADNTGVPVAVTSGIFSYVLGSTAPLFPSPFTGANSVRYLQITLNPAAGAEILTPRQLITETGYANLAQFSNNATNSSSLGGVAASGWQQKLTTASCPANQFYNAIGQTGTATCAAAPTGTVTSISTGTGLTGGPINSSGTISLVVPVSIANGGTGSASQNFVDLTTAQTVAGAKTFSSIITGSISGNAATATTAANFSGSLAGDVTGTQGATVVATVGFQTATFVGAGAVLANAATNLNTPNTIVKRLNSGDFSAGTITAALNGNAATATTAAALSANGANCPAGQYSLGVDAAGNAEGCAAVVQAAPPYSLTSLDGIGSTGYQPSITLGSDGLGLISYFDATNMHLKAAHCSDVACTTATAATLLDSGVNTGSDSSITIGSDGLGLISYVNTTDSDLKVAHCSDVICSSATYTSLDTAGNVGTFTSITIGRDGLGLISYYDSTNGNLKVAHCSNVNCSSASFASPDTGGDVGQFTSITIGSDGFGLISYYDVTNGDLKAVHCTNVLCSGSTFASLDTTGDVGQFTSIAIGSDGLGLISYQDVTNGDLKVAHCANIACSSASFASPDTVGVAGADSSITIGSDGLGLISYSNGGNLKVAHCSNAACSGSTVTVLLGTLGYSSITVGSDGMGLIGYRGGGGLSVAHCSNARCTPYTRRR